MYTTAGAQRTFPLEIVATDRPAAVQKIPYKKILSSKEELQKEIRNFLFTLYDNAWLAARFDSIHTDSLLTKAFLFVGETYTWMNLRKGNVDEGILSESGFREKLFRNKPVYFKDVRKLQERILSWCENNGYPFASVRLDSVVIAGSSISARLLLEKNIVQKIDSVLIRGKAGIAPVYVQNYIGIRPGSLYDESKVRKISSRLKELSFIRESRPFEVLFTQKNAQLRLYLEKKKASQFDGIIGFLPDNVTGRLLLTGDVRLRLQNAFSRGELMELNWRSLQAGTQDLKSQFVYPFLFNTPFGADLSFKLYKKDSTYIDVNPSVGIQYLLSGANYLKVFLNEKRSDLLSTSAIQFQPVLPPYADVTTILYGIGLRLERLDYRLNPRKGYTLQVTTSAGTKTIRKNAKLNPIAYEGIALSTTQYSSDLEAGFFFPFGTRSTVLLANRSGYMYNSFPGSTFQNELFRIGGLRTLRGFDEESIRATSYYIFTIELRYLLEQNSYFYLFGDGAYYENDSRNMFVHDTPFGFGAGISFETKAGIFSISYALGRQFNNPIDLRGGKIHFGIVNIF